MKPKRYTVHGNGATPDIFIAGHYLTVEEVGYYSVGIYVASLVLNKIMPLLNQIALPAYSRVSQEPGAIPYYLKKIVNVAALLCFPLFFGLACVASQFIEFPIPNYMNAILPLVLLCMLMPLRLLSYLLPSAVYAAGKPAVEFSNTAIAAVIVIPAFIISVQWGLIGLCIGWLASFPIVFAIQLYRSAKAIGISISGYLGQTTAGLVCSSGMAVVVLITRSMIDDLGLSVFVELALLTGVGIFSYIVLLVLGYRSSLNEALHMFRSK